MLTLWHVDMVPKFWERSSFPHWGPYRHKTLHDTLHCEKINYEFVCVKLCNFVHYSRGRILCQRVIPLTSCYVLHGTFHGKQSQSFQKFVGMIGATPSLPTVHYDTNHNDGVSKR